MISGVSQGGVGYTYNICYKFLLQCIRSVSFPFFKVVYFFLHKTSLDKQYALMARDKEWGNANISQEILDG